MSCPQCCATTYNKSAHKSQINIQEVKSREYGEDNCAVGGCYGMWFVALILLWPRRNCHVIVVLYVFHCICLCWYVLLRSMLLSLSWLYLCLWLVLLSLPMPVPCHRCHVNCCCVVMVIGIIVILMNCNIIVMLHLCSLLIYAAQKLRKHYLK